MRLEELINQHYSILNDNDLYIWDYISKHPEECEKMAIDQLAYKCNVSRTTILRFAKKLSLKGYGELKVYLSMDNAAPKESRNNIDLVCQTYQQLIAKMKEKDCTDICRSIYEAKNLYIYGTGMIQSSVQKELKRMFLSGGKLFYDINGQYELKSVVHGVSQEDLVIIVSLSGESNHILEFAKALKVRNVPIVSITRLKENELAKLSTHNLYVSTATINEDNYMINYESATSYFMLVELLFLQYIEYQKSVSDEGKE